MGDDKTARKTKTIAEHEKNMMEETEKVLKAETEDARMIRKNYVEITTNQRRVHDTEMAKEGEKSTEAIRRNASRLEEVKADNRLTLIALNKEKAESNKQKLAEVERSGQREVEERRSRQVETVKRIDEMKAETKSEYIRQIEINKNVQSQKTSITIAAETKAEKQTKKYKKTLLSLEEEKAAIKAKHEDDRKESAKTHRLQIEELKSEQYRRRTLEAIGTKKMLDAAQQDSQHSQFARQGRLVVLKFNEFKTEYGKEEKMVMRVSAEMKKGKEVTCFPNLKPVNAALQSFSNENQRLVVPAEYENLQVSVDRTATKIADSLRTIDTELYTTNGKIDGDSKIIDDSLEKVRVLVSELSELVLLFNIRPSTHVGEALAIEMSNYVKKPVQKQIENGAEAERQKVAEAKEETENDDSSEDDVKGGEEEGYKVEEEEEEEADKELDKEIMKEFGSDFQEYVST
uniref:BRCT domain-containing protein n=1 Tax=Caenorhabditis tropicalis TaxID=1561998 RepID=A0A1I7UGH1_9PELO